jgi:hypothetical protein
LRPSSEGFDLGQHFEADGQLGVLAFFIAFAERHGRLHRGTQLVVGHELVHRFANGRLQRFLVQGRAVHLLDQVGGHLAGTEAGHAHLRGDLLDFTFHARGDVRCRDGHGVGALQALVAGFDDLHPDPTFSNDAATRRLKIRA